MIFYAVWAFAKFFGKVGCLTVSCIVHRVEMYNMQKELFKERARCQSLQEELETPLNVHRWRKLEVRAVRRYKALFGLDYFYMLEVETWNISVDCSPTLSQHVLHSNIPPYFTFLKINHW